MVTVQLIHRFFDDLPILSWWFTSPTALTSGALLWNFLALALVVAERMLTGVPFIDPKQKRIFFICAGGTTGIQLLIYIIIGKLYTFEMTLPEKFFPGLYFLTLFLIFVAAIHFFVMLALFLKRWAKSMWRSMRELLKKIGFRRIIITAVTIVMVAAVVTAGYCYKQVKETQPAEAATWPERGEVIATIDGKPYRYDPVYLYRLTGDVFPEDPTEEFYDSYGYFKVTNLENFYEGHLSGEVAVLLELVALDGAELTAKKSSPPDPNRILQGRRREYRYLTGDDSLEKGPGDYVNVSLLARNGFQKMHKKARFEPFDSGWEFFKDERLWPYLEKFAPIWQVRTEDFKKPLEEKFGTEINSSDSLFAFIYLAEKYRVTYEGEFKVALNDWYVELMKMRYEGTPYEKPQEFEDLTKFVP